MVRTKADSVPAAYRKAVAAAAPRKSLGSSPANASPSCSSQTAAPAKGKYAGGNPVCPRPTPTWQKGIGDFFGGPPRKPEKENQRPQEEQEAGGSGVTSRKPEKENQRPQEEQQQENQRPQEQQQQEAGGSGVTSRKSRPLLAEEEEDE